MTKIYLLLKSAKITFLLFCALFLAQTVFSQSTISASIVSGGLTRTYRLYIPASYNGSVAVPLVFNLHGYGSNNVQQESYGDFRPIADTANFILVHPNGTLDTYNKQFWNCFNGSTVNDVGFISDLLDTISAHYNIDPNSVYSTGLSNGGFMSYDLACQLGNRIAAIASVAGDMTYIHKNACNAPHPTPVMQIHGTADGTVPYAGTASFLPVDSLVRYWVKYNNCSLTPVITPVPNTNTSDGCTADNYLYSGGNMGSTVEFYRVLGGDHSWPGAYVNINTTNMDFSASVVIWRFFRKYKLNQLTNGIQNNAAVAQALSVYPNPSSGNFVLSFATNSKKAITITNYLGATVQSFQCSDKTTEIRLENKGLYFVTICEGNKTRVEKIIKD